MQLSEAHQLGVWAQREIRDKKIPEAYGALHSILQNNVSNQPNQPFENEKNALLEKLRAVPTHWLSVVQMEALEKLQMADTIGNRGANQVQSMLSNVLDIAHVAKSIKQMISRLNSGLSQIQTLDQGVLPFVEVDAEELGPDEILARVNFQDEASISNITELKQWSAKLFDMGRGFAIAQGKTEKDIRVVGASSGSIIVGLAFLATMAFPIARAIRETLDGMISYHRLRIEAMRARRMKIELKGFEKDFEEDAERLEQRAEALKAQIADQVAKEVEKSIEKFRKENRAELEKAVRILVDLYAKGGSVDCAIPDNPDEEASEEAEAAIEDLRQEFIQIRDMRERYLLEYKPASENDEKDESQ